MSIYVFTGPTLSPDAARCILDATYLPPVSQGDVYRVARLRPRAIGIIDGYFHRVPAVWHKEILWALSQGIRVFGSASMGALRAAELATFGMEGVGWVFEAFKSGQLEDDDEVALLHSPIQIGGVYPTYSEPMVNIRRTIDLAVSESVIADSTANELKRIAKGLYYGERTYSRILALTCNARISAAELDEFRRWSNGHRVDQKQADAIQMLRAMRESMSGSDRKTNVDFAFEATELWRRLCTSARLEQPTECSFAVARHNNVPGNGELSAQREAILRWALLQIAHCERIEVDQSTFEDATIAFRKERGLFQTADLEQWMDDNDVTMPELIRLLEDEAKIKSMEPWLGLESQRMLLDVIKLRKPRTHQEQPQAMPTS